MVEVADFKDPIMFWRIWLAVPHSDPSKFFSFKDEQDQLMATFYDHPISKKKGKI